MASTKIDKFVEHLNPDNPRGRMRIEEAAFGKAPLGPDSYSSPRCLGEIKAYNIRKNVYDVYVNGRGGTSNEGEEFLPHVVRKTQNTGDHAPLPPGTIVVIDRSLGFPYIDGVLDALGVSPYDVDEDNSQDLGYEMPASVLDDAGSGDDDADYSKPHGVPKDIIPQDFVQSSPEGNFLAILRSKLNILYGSKKAQIQTFGVQDLVRIIAEDYEQLTSLGNLKIFNEGGRASLEYRAAADQLNESGGSEDHWTFRLDLGHRGNLFDMRVTTPDGKTLSRVYLSADGKVEILGVNGVDLVDGGTGTKRTEIAGSPYTKIQGNETTQIDGNSSLTVKGSRSVRVSQNESKMVGNDQSTSVNRDIARSVGGHISDTITGGPITEAAPTNVAYETNVLNGSYHIYVGNPLQGASPSAKSSFRVFVNNGEIALGEDTNPFGMPSSKVAVGINTSLPDSVGLGGMPSQSLLPSIGMQHAMGFEPFSTLMRAVIQWCDTHIHGTTWGPSSAPSVPLSSSASSLVDPCMSTRVQLYL